MPPARIVAFQTNVFVLPLVKRYQKRKENQLHRVSLCVCYVLAAGAWCHSQDG